MTSQPAQIQATFCATLVDEWIRHGLTHAVLAPGSRSTPMALALAERDEIELAVVLDERSAAFCAVGVGLATGSPALVLTTSGTAAVHLHAAVVEADLARVPLVALTADRPPELRQVGAPQTIDQNRLYGHSVRWFHDPGVIDAEALGRARALAGRVVAEALGPPAGPVQLNLPFREPLVAEAGPLPPAREPVWTAVRRSAAPDPDVLDELAGRLSGRRGVIVAGRGAPPTTVRLAGALGWPVLADPRAGVAGARVLAAFDAVLRHPELVEGLDAELVLAIGEPPASKVLGQWAAEREQIRLVPEGSRFVDPDHRLALWVSSGDLEAAVSHLVLRVGACADEWLLGWVELERAAQGAIARVLAEHPHSEPAVARLLLEELAGGSALVVSSSMPVRDLEWFARRRSDLRVLANRGANGIDGVLSSSIGVARTGVPTTVLLGDLAFLHDLGGLGALPPRGLAWRAVVLDNDGGGIFSFLPQRQRLSPERFELLFGTPQHRDLVAAARALGVEAERVDGEALRDRVAVPASEPEVLVVEGDRQANLELHQLLVDEVGRACR